MASVSTVPAAINTATMANLAARTLDTPKCLSIAATLASARGEKEKQGVPYFHLVKGCLAGDLFDLVSSTAESTYA